MNQVVRAYVNMSHPELEVRDELRDHPDWSVQSMAVYDNRLIVVYNVGNHISISCFMDEEKPVNKTTKKKTTKKKDTSYWI